MIRRHHTPKTYRLLAGYLVQSYSGKTANPKRAYTLKADKRDYALANGAIHIGYAVALTLQADTALYFDTPGDVGFTGFGKFNQGHWARMFHGQFANNTGLTPADPDYGDDLLHPMTQSARNAVWQGFINDSRGGATSGPTNLKGFVRFINWRQLEQGTTQAAAQAARTFAEISGDLLYLTSKGMRYMICIETRAYTNGGNQGNPCPDYVLSHGDTTGGQAAVFPGYIGSGSGPGGLGSWDTRIYQSFVRERFKDLLTAIASASVIGDTGGPGGTARTFDTHPNFEGIFFQETAIGIKQADLNTDNSYFINGASGTPILADYFGARNGQKSVCSGVNTIMTFDGVVSHACNVFPNSRIFWCMNFLAGQEKNKQDVAAALAPAGIVMGGPDCEPDSAQFSKDPYGEYKVMNLHRLDPLPTMITVSSPQYSTAHNDHVPWDSYYGAAGIPDWTGTARLWTCEETYLFAIRNPDGVTAAEYNAKPGLAVKYLFWFSNGKWSNTSGDAVGANSACGTIQKYPIFNP